MTLQKSDIFSFAAVSHPLPVAISKLVWLIPNCHEQAEIKADCT